MRHPFKDLHGRFQNRLMRKGPANPSFQAFYDLVRYRNRGKPNTPVPVETIQIDSVKNNTMSWLGHSSILLKINKSIILIDPVFTQRASPFSFAGPKKYTEKNPFEIEDIPEVTVVLLSHDHYDHLDKEAMQKLAKKTQYFLVPTGVEKHLKKWGVHPEKIIVHEWWQHTSINDITFISTPTQHFSGRSLTDRNATLWTSWVMETKKNRYFFSSDSGYFHGFKEIGEKFGSFDLAMMECGAYSEYWPSVHMFPEQTAKAFSDVKGKKLLPIHWGKFNMSLHPWDEPIKRLLKVIDRSSVLTPRIGQLFRFDQHPSENWWEEVQ